MASVISPPSVEINDKQFRQLVVTANKVMIVALFVFLLSISASYGVGDYLPLTAQVAAHLTTIISAAIFKLGYAARCVGAFNLGHKAF